jgi:hypothetical protein
MLASLTIFVFVVCLAQPVHYWTNSQNQQVEESILYSNSRNGYVSLANYDLGFFTGYLKAERFSEPNYNGINDCLVAVSLSTYCVPGINATSYVLAEKNKSFLPSYSCSLSVTITLRNQLVYVASSSGNQASCLFGDYDGIPHNKQNSRYTQTFSTNIGMDLGASTKNGLSIGGNIAFRPPILRQ